MRFSTFVLCCGGLPCFCGAVIVRDHDLTEAADASVHDLYRDMGRDSLIAELGAMTKQLVNLEGELVPSYDGIKSDSSVNRHPKFCFSWFSALFAVNFKKMAGNNGRSYILEISGESKFDKSLIHGFP